MARIYSPNEDYDKRGIGVEFFNGVGESSIADVIANFRAKGYSIDSTVNGLSQFDKLKKAELVEIAQTMGLSITKLVVEEQVPLTKQELVLTIEDFVNKGILPFVSALASTGLTDLKLTFSESLYDGDVAVANNADLKAKFTASEGVTITSAVYTSATKKITFVLDGAAENATLVYTGVSLKDSKGGVLGNLAYTAGAAIWGVTE